MIDAIANIWPLLVAILGFGALIFLHELGHFLTARWAGVRVHQFALGFGPAIASYRKGMGFHKGSSGAEYAKLLETKGKGGEPGRLDTRHVPGVSATEYRINWLPFGGYVKMLGQEDLDPTATSNLSDSYTGVPIWKRMIIVSGGILVNLMVAAVLFISVFMAGLPAAAPVIGAVAPADNADTSIQTQGKTGTNSAALPGLAKDDNTTLMPGDRILRVGQSRIRSFNDVIVAVAMAKASQPLDIKVERAGASTPVTVHVTPRKNEQTSLLDIASAPALTTTIIAPTSSENKQLLAQTLARAGLAGVTPGASLIEADGERISGLWRLNQIIRASGGKPIPVTVADPIAHEREQRELLPQSEMQVAIVTRGEDETPIGVRHLLGLTPAVRVAATTPRAENFGLRTGDIFAGVDGVAWPDRATLLARVRSKAGQAITLTVLRDDALVDIEARVKRDGAIGFFLGDTLFSSARITTPTPAAPRRAQVTREDGSAFPAAALMLPPGSIITRVGDTSVANFADIRAAFLEATAQAFAKGASAELPISMTLPIASAADASVSAQLKLSASDIRDLHSLTWVNPLSFASFDPMMTLLRAHSPFEAVAMGVSETRRVILMTYLTLVRLVQGSVEVKSLKGPVGIADIGTQVARTGLIQLLFFLAVISANLAVVNFLPLPIVDGGLFLMLLYEQIRGKPVPVAAQSALTLVGIGLIGALFLVVTFNDVMSLLH